MSNAQGFAEMAKSTFLCLCEASILAKVAGTGPLGTHAFMRSYRSRLDAVGTPVAVQ